MTEKTEKTWKAIGGVTGGLAALIAIIVFLTGKTSLPEFFSTSPTTTIAAPTITQVGTNPTDPTTGVRQQLAVGDTTHFGQYDWRVLDVQDGKVLLLSEDIIEQLPYNTDWIAVTWETCSLRAYLNGAFYESFSEADRARIALTRNENPNNTWGTWDSKRFNTPGGNSTDDYIFLLSVPDILKHFPGLKLHKNSDWGEEWLYEADERLMAKFKDDKSSWWLRSPGIDSMCAAHVGDNGGVSLGGLPSPIEDGVRPALWLNL